MVQVVVMFGSTYIRLFPFIVVYCCTYMLSGDDLFLSRRVCSGGGDAVVKVWDIRTGDNVLTLQGHTQEVVCITISIINFF